MGQLDLFFNANALKAHKYCEMTHTSWAELTISTIAQLILELHGS